MDKFTKRVESLSKRKAIIEVVKSPIVKDQDHILDYKITPLEEHKDNYAIITNNTIIIPNQSLLSLLTYTKPPSIGLVIGTHGSVPYIHLHLESWRRLYPSIPVLVHDDCSDERDKLVRLCKDYNVDFEYNSIGRGHMVGDLSVFFGGLCWANKRKIDLLVKMSRRFIPLVDWTTNLTKLAFESQGATFSNICECQDYGFRSECVGLSVRRWVDNGLMNEIARRIHDPEYVFVEAFIHNLAKRVHCICPHTIDWQNQFGPIQDDKAGYVQWDFINHNRSIRSDNYLWHYAYDQTFYHKQMKSFGLLYD